MASLIALPDLPPRLPTILLYLLLALILFPILYHCISRDYSKASKDGIPFILPGYTCTALLRQLRHCNWLTIPIVTSELWLRRGYLENLPHRRGTRPQVAGIAPQRQLDQRGPQGMCEALSTLILDVARDHPLTTYLGRSTFQQHNTALFSRCRMYAETRYFGEICHAHLIDGSMHLTLHPSDVKTVIENGWGERHPLARNGWWWGIWPGVSSDYTMIYAPRDAGELQVCGEVVRAAVWWVSGIDSKIVGESWT